jgi:hypothetical protein
MSVTFTARRTSPTVDDYRCNETGVHYQIERRSDGYLIRNSGNAVCFRLDRNDGMLFIEQQAELDLWTLRAERPLTIDWHGRK